VKNIYLIDDDPIFVFLTKRIINSAQCDCQINEFSDGQLAISHLQEIIDDVDLLPDIIFLDLSMPVMDGWEFLEEYALIQSRIKKKIALFIVSSSISPHEVERSKTFLSVTDFVIKPMEKGKVIEIIDSLDDVAQA
jgi:CheY-like chemotaxis protein